MTAPSGRISPSGDDDHDEWMAMFGSLSDPEVDDLLAGRPSSAANLAGLAELVEVLRSDARRAGAPEMSAALRRQVAGVAVVRPARKRRRALAGGVLGVVLGASAMGGAAAQNALPGPLQDAVSSAGGAIGIDLPRTDSDTPEGPGPDDPGVEGSEGRHGTTTSEQRQDAPVAPGHQPQATPNGPPDTTPGVATPADPGTPGDHEPATPATPTTPTTPTPPTTSRTTPTTGGPSDDVDTDGTTPAPPPGPDDDPDDPDERGARGPAR